MKKSVIGGLLTLVLATAFVMQGCFGSFKLTSDIKNWNGKVSNSKFVQEVVFLGLNIIPVYGVAVLADVWVFNLIEFWTDSNPLALKSIQDGKDQVVMKYDSRADNVNVYSFHNGRPQDHIIVARAASGHPVMKHLDKALTATVGEDGYVTVTDKAGKVIDQKQIGNM